MAYHPSERHIFMTADLVIKQHGAGARLYALTRAAELQQLGDGAGAVVWQRIEKAIADLLNEAPEGPTN